MDVLIDINKMLGLLFLICYSYQIFYIVVALIKKKRQHNYKELTYHKFAFLISARNEQTVIADLIKSIKNQNYPSELITIFVVADNCTDDTAEIARKAGAKVYERFDKTKVGKGYALDYLLCHINEDYPKDAFDAFFVFDADNVLAENYVTEMNKTYCDGYLAITSYRNSKNYGDNWITAGYSLWFLREAKYLNNSRMILRTSCAVSGTGFMFDRSLIENEKGEKRWNYFLLTEDIEFTASNIVKGNCVGYCDSAEFYDEQPVTFGQSWNQRLRWAKGYLQVYSKYGKNLIKGIFSSKRDVNNTNNIRRRFSCFDMTMTIMPAMILSAAILTADVLGAFIMLFAGKWVNALILLMYPTINASILIFLIGIITTITEWNKIHTANFKKVLYVVTFPLFMLTYIPIAITALFSKKVEWKQIEHSKRMNLTKVSYHG